MLVNNKFGFLFGAISLSPMLMAQEQPNVIIIFTDDQGYGDLGCFGSTTIATPNIDKIAAEGVKATNFYVSASVSSASRASLLTGKLNTNNGVHGVYFPGNKGMSPEQVTIAEVLKQKNYATACIGKWHLGDRPESLPTKQGFDYYYGIPYSNDMYIGPTHTFSPQVNFTDGYTLEKAQADIEYVKTTKDNNGQKKNKLKMQCPLFENEQIIEYPCHQATLTNRLFTRTIDFIDEQLDNGNNFFVYLTPSMPHLPVFVTNEFAGSSKCGIYGDAVQEIDWNVGRLMQYLESVGCDENTLVIYASDNGPWLGHGEESGTSGVLRDGKFSLYEGGVRVPFVAKWPNVIPAGIVQNDILASIDIFPTITNSVGIPDKEINVDGMNILRALQGKKSPRDDYFYFRNGSIVGVRQNDWVCFPNGGFGKRTKSLKTTELYNLKSDPSQKNNLHDSHAKKSEKLSDYLNKKLKP